MVINMKYFIFLCICVTLTSCGVQNNKRRFVPGAVARQVVFCTNPEECKQKLSADCPNGGVIHRGTPALQLEYSCHNNIN